MAWKTPGFTIENTSVEEPRNDGSTATLRKSTETIMMTMDTKAKLDDFESFTMSRCRLRGKEMNKVHMIMTAWRLTNRRRKTFSAKEGKM